MSNTDGTCEYVLDPDDPETWGGEGGDKCYVDEEVLNEDGVWNCPHDAEESEELCVFHLPVDRKDNQDVIEAFVDKIDKIDDSIEYKTRTEFAQFLGAEFKELDLSEVGDIFANKEGIDVDFSYSVIEDGIDWPEKHIDCKHLYFNGVKCNGISDFSGSMFNCEVSFRDIVFKGAIFERAELEYKVTFDGARFEEFIPHGFSEVTGVNFANFTDTTFRSKASFNNAKFPFSGLASFENTEFKGYTSFKSAKFEGVNFERAIFKQESSFKYMRVEKNAYFLDATFEDRVDFSDATFGKSTYFGQDVKGAKITTFEKFANFVRTTFKGESYFRMAEFKDVASFEHGEFQKDTLFNRAKFYHDTQFIDICFKKDVTFNHAEFSGIIEFNESKFENNTYFGRCEFEDDAFFDDVEFTDGVYFEQSKFFENANFENLDLYSANFREADLTDARFVDTNLQKAALESALLSRATLFGSDLRGAKLSGAVLGDVRINEDTKFLGHPSDDDNVSPHTFSAIRSQQCCVYDPDYEKGNEHEDVDKAKSVYRALEELGGKHARPRLQARSFVRRQDLQKQDYWDDATTGDASLEERLIAGARWSRARVARTTLLYGESPWRVIAWSLGIILSFALLYPLGGWMKAEEASEPLSYSQIPVSFLSEPLGWLGGFLNILADSLYYSTLTYTALGFGDFQPEGFGRLLTTVETGFGAVMLALLVFILGRRAAR